MAKTNNTTAKGAKKPAKKQVESLTHKEAKRRNIPGRSQMTKAQLQRAVDARK